VNAPAVPKQAMAVMPKRTAKFWELVPATGKKNLADAPILKCLEER
jgi:single-stranded-DNA-specific exonuclease